MSTNCKEKKLVRKSSQMPTENRTRAQLGRRFSALTIDTKVICSRTQSPGGGDVDPITIPIYHSAVYRNISTQHYQDSLDQNGYIYQSWGNPTTATAEVIINELERGKGCLMFASGLAAVTTTMMCFLKSGDHIICQKPCYSGTSDFIKEIMQKFGVEADWVKAGAGVDEYAKKVKPNTRMFYGETPCNPDMTILDLEEFGKLGTSLPNVITVVDATFGSPYLQKTLKYGINVSIHSCSKYLGGHNDVIGGCATVNDIDLWQQLKMFQAYNGTAHAPFDSYLLVRGLKTLSLRMIQHSKNGLAIAKFLEANPKVKKVYYPGLESHPQHEIAKKQMTGFGGMISFEMNTLEEARTVVENVHVINLAASLGGTESLIVHPATMTLNPKVMCPDDRRKSGIADGLIRLSIGLEDVEDLKADLGHALSLVGEEKDDDVDSSDNDVPQTETFLLPRIIENDKWNDDFNVVEEESDKCSDDCDGEDLV